MKDAAAQAREICTAHIRAPWSTDDYHLRDAIAAALRAEREQALEECLAVLSEELEDCYDADWGAHQERKLTVQAWLMNARARVSALKERKP